MIREKHHDRRSVNAAVDEVGWGRDPEALLERGARRTLVLIKHLQCPRTPLHRAPGVPVGEFLDSKRGRVSRQVKLRTTRRSLARAPARWAASPARGGVSACIAGGARAIAWSSASSAGRSKTSHSRRALWSRAGGSSRDATRLASRAARRRERAPRRGGWCARAKSFVRSICAPGEVDAANKRGGGGRTLLRSQAPAPSCAAGACRSGRGQRAPHTPSGARAGMVSTVLD